MMGVVFDGSSCYNYILGVDGMGVWRGIGGVVVVWVGENFERIRGCLVVY